MPFMAIDKARKAQAMRVFGSQLRELREQRGWTPHQVAKEIGQTYDSVIKYERGVREPPLYQLVELADLFQVSIHRLVTGREFHPRVGRVVSIRRGR